MNESDIGLDDKAQTISLLALAFIANRPQLLQGLFQYSGVTLDDLKPGITDPEFLGGILDFLLQGDKHISEFCEETAVSLEELRAARQKLPGWTEPY